MTRQPAWKRGQEAERMARRYLEANGMRWECNNYRCRLGEIDLVMRDGDTTVFVEVRLRTNVRFGSGAETVDAAKQRRLIAAAEHYLQRHPKAAGGPCRFDVVTMGSANQQEPLEWLRNAIEVR